MTPLFTMVIYDHFQDVPRKAWPCQFFSPVEIACKGTGEILVNVDALRAFDELRSMLDKPFSPNSAYRSAYHNAAVGGAPFSRHRTGDAFDIPLSVGSKEEIERLARLVGFKGFGMRYNTFVHIDMGRRRQW